MTKVMLFIIIGVWVLGKIGEYRIWKRDRDRYLKSIGW